MNYAPRIFLLVKNFENKDIDNLFKLEGKVAVVTGGGDGIGKGRTQILTSAGALVVVNDINP